MVYVQYQVWSLYSTKYGLCTVPSMVYAVQYQVWSMLYSTKYGFILLYSTKYDAVQYQVWSMYSTKYGLCCTVPSMVYVQSVPSMVYVQYQVWSMVIGHWLGWNDILRLEWRY